MAGRKEGLEVDDREGTITNPDKGDFPQSGYTKLGPVCYYLPVPPGGLGGLTGWPKTSGSRGFHIYCRIETRWTFAQVRNAGLALAREVERRAPELATSRWWKEERHGVFVDYNQNAKDRTTASAYSIRPTPDARVSTPLHWDEVPDCVPEAYTIDTVPEQIGRASCRERV